MSYSSPENDEQMVIGQKMLMTSITSPNGYVRIITKRHEGSITSTPERNQTSGVNDIPEVYWHQILQDIGGRVVE